MQLVAPTDKSPTRCFSVQMMEVVWRQEEGSPGGEPRKPTIVPHRSIMSRPASFEDFCAAVHLWAGVQPGKVRELLLCKQRPTACGNGEMPNPSLASWSLRSTGAKSLLWSPTITASRRSTSSLLSSLTMMRPRVRTSIRFLGSRLEGRGCPREKVRVPVNKGRLAMACPDMIYYSIL